MIHCPMRCESKERVQKSRVVPHEPRLKVEDDSTLSGNPRSLSQNSLVSCSGLATRRLAKGGSGRSEGNAASCSIIIAFLYSVLSIQVHFKEKAL